MPNPKDTLSLVERLTSARKGARTEEDARAIADAQNVIERLTSQGGAPDVTDDMAEAGRDWAQREWKASGDPKGYLDFYRGIYRAMLSAAPQPPVSQSAPDGFADQMWGLSILAQAELDNGDIEDAQKTLVRIAEVASAAKLTPAPPVQPPERAAKVADNYARDGRTHKELACETADEIAARIRSLAVKEGEGV